MKRHLMPQWMVSEESGKALNLGKFEVECPELTKSDLQAMLDKSPEAFGEMVAGQLHIKFGSMEVKRFLMEHLAIAMPKEKDEKAPAYLARTYEQAKLLAADNVPGMTMDYVGTFNKWVDEVFAKRGASGDAIVTLIRSKWAGSTNEKRAAFLAKFGLPSALLDKTAEEVVTAYKADAAEL